VKIEGKRKKEGDGQCLEVRGENILYTIPQIRMGKEGSRSPGNTNTSPEGKVVERSICRRCRAVKRRVKRDQLLASLGLNNK